MGKITKYEESQISLIQLITSVVKDGVPQSPNPLHEKKPQVSAPAARAQVVGWPPIRSFRKNSMASIPTKKNDDVEGKMGEGCLYVKVSMDGAPYLRTVDRKTYGSYVDLSLSFEKMFSCFTIGNSCFNSHTCCQSLYPYKRSGSTLCLHSFGRKLGLKMNEKSWGNVWMPLRLSMHQGFKSYKLFDWCNTCTLGI
ncbi:auxin-responsive protein IAA27-like isoform X1 [Argentina anserina]|uniref:auxin-responsive protein IAA27-like isoform X1 n=1 Tax=Argentina anserina TaxID=57926 RepID=UPI0021764201|nr:auxin-responsive protein IAA27-like isoform X1 [Potentilla anserina]XP_050372716.1 auxin-responsive protein IAA27-like isoform X1 [Potentilla anserina]XP_050372717.1 auxin-responsive protein IAA27-like isoform X1 [Potentilla anserina]XP_050372718.1 auxin-responsive protein IAA27-like isoform X1 [Potentilla anserina]XP_050372719.1 auxin-responsive protein IAA27-like isoform X1 [Potentilla anserina]